MRNLLRGRLNGQVKNLVPVYFLEVHESICLLWLPMFPKIKVLIIKNAQNKTSCYGIKPVKRNRELKSYIPWLYLMWVYLWVIGHENYEMFFFLFSSSLVYFAI